MLRPKQQLVQAKSYVERNSGIWRLTCDYRSMVTPLPVTSLGSRGFGCGFGSLLLKQETPKPPDAQSVVVVEDGVSVRELQE
jgi:hypothetical protein